MTAIAERQKRPRPSTGEAKLGKRIPAAMNALIASKLLIEI